MQYTCTNCGKIHDEWPAIGFDAPDNYGELSESDRQICVKELSDDFCVIEYENQTDLFIRCVLLQEVKDYCEELQYGVWVSLSEKSFEDYNDSFLSEEQNATYFGYLCTLPPEYEYTRPIKTNVITRSGRNRPEIVPHKDQMDIPFVRDYYEGISKDEAERRINRVMGKKL